MDFWGKSKPKKHSSREQFWKFVTSGMFNSGLGQILEHYLSMPLYGSSPLYSRALVLLWAVHWVQWVTLRLLGSSTGAFKCGFFFFFFASPRCCNSVFWPCFAVVSQRTVCPIRWPRAQACQWPVVCLVRVVRVHSHLWRGGHLSRKTLQ